ncbi:hypothetical protein AmaxDRAFT_0222 [Limnospira maxima CS-328]|uniref:Uncharacterized protein n=1 Tax=Limnospira maxima CS-328 TaxID=513049 RepID=B5VUH7_LIMMA|nr:hypothetical protein AmaxDRAFT_0222 [Limnospira maxima CS-328]UWU50993.1 hypothetical protein APLC1_5949 [Arthrospira platensis C1]
MRVRLPIFHQGVKVPLRGDFGHCSPISLLNVSHEPLEYNVRLRVTAVATPNSAILILEIQLLSGGMSNSRPSSIKVRRWSQLSQRTVWVSARKSLKKVWRVGKCARSNWYLLSSNSSRVWKSSERMLRVASKEERCCLPWPKLCSRW